MTTREWRALLRWLRRRFPVSGTVAVVRRPIRDCGRTITDGCGRFRIAVKSDQDAQGQIDTLLHEWAHCLAIEEAYHHEGRWSALYGEIYDTWVRHFNEA